MGQGNLDEGGFSRVGILGDDLNLTISNKGQDYAISGTVKAFEDIGFDGLNNPYGYIPNYSVVGMNISANKLVDAINSSSKSDDKELLEEALGDDTLFPNTALILRIIIRQLVTIFFMVMQEMIPFNLIKEMISLMR